MIDHGKVVRLAAVEDLANRDRGNSMGVQTDVRFEGSMGVQLVWVCN